MMGQLLFICIAAPYTLCFAIEYDLGSALGVVNAAINASFALDILINFRTGLWGQ